MENRSILISGAGVAGLALAYWLKRYGFSPTLIEKAPSLRTGGYKVDIRGTALEVVKRMGLHAQISAAKTDIQGASIVNKEGQLITEMSGDTYGLRAFEDLEIMRGDLLLILQEHAQEVPCLFQDSIRSIEQDKEQVHVVFEQHAPRSFDLVIGADGLHSTVRKLAFGEESTFAQNLGLYISIFRVPNPLNLDRWEVEYTEPGRLVNFYSIRGEAKAVFLFASPPLSFGFSNIEAQQRLLQTVFGDLGWEIPKLLAAMKEAPDFYFDSATQICMKHWSQDRVCLIGDAGYCASPLSGQGTSIALVAAYILAGELATAQGNYAIAFKHYEHLLRKYVEENQKFGRKTAQTLISSEKNRFIVWLHDRLMQWMPGKWIHFINNRAVRQITRAARSIRLKDYLA